MHIFKAILAKLFPHSNDYLLSVLKVISVVSAISLALVLAYKFGYYCGAHAPRVIPCDYGDTFSFKRIN